MAEWGHGRPSTHYILGARQSVVTGPGRLKGHARLRAHLREVAGDASTQVHAGGLDCKQCCPCGWIENRACIETAHGG